MKAIVTKVGTFNERGQPIEWGFDHSICPKTPAFDIQADATVIFSGYTVDELREVARRDAAARQKGE